MNINPTYLEISYEGVGVRNSQKRLKGLIAELAVQPIKEYQDELINRFSLVEEIVQKRIAAVIHYWCENKHDPVSPELQNMMSEITNASKNDMTLEEFYISEVKYAMYSLAPTLGIAMPNDYNPPADELGYRLVELRENQFKSGTVFDEPDVQAEVAESVVYMYDDYDNYSEDNEDDFNPGVFSLDMGEDEEQEQMIDLNEVNENDFAGLANLVTESAPTSRREQERERAIVSAPEHQVVEQSQPQQEIRVDLLENLTTEDAWQLIYGLIGYPSEYIQQTMLPRWQQYPQMFEKDRRFLYGLFMDTIRNAAGVQYIAGNFHFADERTTVDGLWNHYYANLSQQITPQLAAARVHNAANDPWHKKLRQTIAQEFKNISIVWIIALVIALIFDGLTTYISLDQTPMEGLIVGIFTVLITALFQIADQLVINYRQREFEAEAMAAKFNAQFERLSRSLEGLEPTSESFVRLSMERSKAHADWKAAQDNRKMARRGRFWSARIADINVIVTAYGFAFLFLNSQEPLYELVQQLDFIFVKGAWESVDLWVFLMVGLAVTVSFVVNTAQRTEILGWSMRRLKKEA